MLQDPIDRHVVESCRNISTKQQEQREVREQDKDAGSQTTSQDKAEQDNARKLTPNVRELERAMWKLIVKGAGAAEVYSPERIVTIAREMGLREGWAFDFTSTDEHLEHWDFDRTDMGKHSSEKHDG